MQRLNNTAGFKNCRRFAIKKTRARLERNDQQISGTKAAKLNDVETEYIEYTAGAAGCRCMQSTLNIDTEFCQPSTLDQ